MIYSHDGFIKFPIEDITCNFNQISLDRIHKSNNKILLSLEIGTHSSYPSVCYASSNKVVDVLTEDTIYRQINEFPRKIVKKNGGTRN